MTTGIDEHELTAGPQDSPESETPPWKPNKATKITIGALAALAVWAVAAALLPQGVPVGVVALGIIFGSTTGLTSVGLILIWRANRVINFANMAIAGIGGTFAVHLFQTWEWPYWISLIAGPLVGLAVGALAEFTVIRRFAKAPRLVLTVATIGLAQLLGGLELLIPERIFGASGLLIPPFTTPLSTFNFDLGPVKVDGNDLLPLFVVPIVVMSLAWFMRRSLAGTAIRASAENTDRARLLGIPVKRLTTAVWALAGCLAALTLVLRAPTLGIAPSVMLGPDVLLAALAAAILGRMESMPKAFGAAMALGVLDQTIRWNTNNPEMLSVVTLAVILIGLLTQARGRSRAHDADSGWKDAELIRPVSPLIAAMTPVRVAKWSMAALLVAAVVLIPMILEPGASFTGSIMVCWAIVGVSLVVLTGWGGQISLGQFAIVGAAAIVAGNLINQWNTDLFVSLAVAVATGAFVAFLLGIPALRIQGPFLAVVTLSFAVVLDSFVLNPSVFPAIIPESVARPVLWGRINLEDERAMLYFTLACLAFVVMLTVGVRRSRSGRLLLASRDNMKAAEAASVPAMWIRLTGFVFSGAIAGLAGGLHMLVNHGARGGSYAPAMSVDVFSLTTIGGLGSIPGAIVGAGGGRGLQDASDILRLVASGLGVLIVLWLVPSGLAGLAARIRDFFLSRLAARQGLDLEGRPLSPVPTGEQEDSDDQSDDSESPAAGDHDSPVVVDQDAKTTDGSPHQVPDSDPVPAAKHPVDSSILSIPTPGNTEGSAVPALSASGVNVSYGQLQILFDVDLDVQDREIVALLGTNGAGKSTIFKAICGLAPHNGTVMLGDVDISRMSPEQIVRQGLALMPGGKAIFPTLTVHDHLRLACWTFRTDSERINDSFEDLDGLFPVLEERRNQMAGDLSGGEQQQLAMAMTLLLRPQVILIDELSLGLSPMIVSALCGVVKQMNAHGITVVVVEQSINVALTLAERAVFMEKGTVRFEGPTRELIERPDLLRSVFIEGAGGGDDSEESEEIAAIDLARLEPVSVDDRPIEEREPILVCSDITKRFGGVQALSHVNLEVRPGEIVGLIGQNGAGKTTLMDCISGFHTIDEGTITFRDTDITDWAPNERARARLGRTFQEARLFPSLSVRDVLAVACERTVASRSLVADATHQPASYLSENMTSTKVDDLLGLLGLGAYANIPVSVLSTGTRRIVELACLLAEEPVVMCLDEPSAGVAQRETEALGPLLRQICEHTGAAMLVIEHDMPLLAGLCDRLVAMELGQVLLEGTPAEVLDHPAVIAAYLGTDAAAINRSGAAVS